jgi:hypothetical protein
MKRALLPLCFALVLAVPTGAQLAAVPSPSNSTVPPCIVYCPQGDIPYTVVVRDLANNPVAGSAVDLDFGPCPNVAFCPVQRPGVVVDFAGRKVRVISASDGKASFPLKAGGLCPGATIRVFADGVLLSSTVEASSPDQDGSLGVFGSDAALHAAGAYTPGKDFDCDGDRDAADTATLNAHMGHTCDAVVPALPKSWGTVKLLYR